MTEDAVHARYAAAAKRALAGEGTGLQTGAKHYEATDDLPCEITATSLGCGNPLAVADLRPGDTVLDLGSGGGLDVLLSARRVGPTGRAIGLDITDDMLTLAQSHAARAGITNAEFRKGTIENIPLPDNSVDAVISNCVIALSADKPAVFAEIARVLRPGGRVGITDVIADDSLTESERAQRAEHVECLAGALKVAEYQTLLRDAGLTAIEVQPTSPAEDKLRSAIIRAKAPPSFRIAAMGREHTDEVLAIYQAGLDTGHASFETTAPDWAAWDSALLAEHRHVAIDPTGRVLGWTAAIPVSSRCVYAGVVEHSVYVHPDHHRRGIGRGLLTALVDSTEQAGIWTIQSGIFPENAASRALHQRAGFREVGLRERVGHHHGYWRDVIMIERRSARVGIG
jgi:L-amino acid N-acyltransferase YncA/2-polyprenyl-3-methyl-5-hydroxy-6-metoxy-1,4-benzoquinol methylase